MSNVMSIANHEVHLRALSANYKLCQQSDFLGTPELLSTLPSCEHSLRLLLEFVAYTKSIKTIQACLLPRNLALRVLQTKQLEGFLQSITWISSLVAEAKSSDSY